MESLRWAEAAKLVPTVFDAANDFSGEAVAVHGTTAVVGNPLNDAFGLNAGWVDVLELGAGGWSTVQTLTSPDIADGDSFGASVAIHGDTIVIGASGDDDDGSRSGSVYVFERSAGTWSHAQKLTASDAQADDVFGGSVDVSSDTLVVGARLEDDGGSKAGAAYVFVRSGGVWSEQQKLTASDAEAEDEFGSSVGVDGDTVVVGARNEDELGANAGAAYVFIRSAGVWAQQQKLVGSAVDTNDRFGTSVAIDGETVAVGAPGSTSGAYIFVRDTGSWTEQQRIGAPGSGDDYGVSVSLSGDTVAVGAPRGNFPATDTGYVSVWVRSGTTWSLEHKVAADDGDGGDWLGKAVAVDGDRMLAGAIRDEVVGQYSGSAYVFSRVGTFWAQQHKWLPTPTAGSHKMGTPVSADGDRIAAGVPSRQNSKGGVYIFVRGPSGWALEQYIPPASSGNDRFGHSLALSGDSLLVGASHNDDAGGSAGTAYAYVRSGGVWMLEQQLFASDAAANDFFGSGVSLDADTAVLTASTDRHSGAGRGAAYIFVRSAGVWTEQGMVDASDLTNSGEYMASSVALDGDTMVTGCLSCDFNGDHSGAAYVFTRTAGVWTEAQRLTPAEPSGNDRFGGSVSVEGDTILVGAVREDDGGIDSGAAYVFTRSGGVWTEQQKLKALDKTGGDEFGNSVRLHGDLAVIGAHFNNLFANVPGAAYVFARTDGVWAQTQKVTASDAADADAFGTTVDIADGMIAIGAIGDDDVGANSGSIYAYEVACGNGELNAALGEACDDGASNSDTEPDACRLSCQPAGCNDGVIDMGEACDDGANNSDTAVDACRTTCVVAHCGDEVVDTGEACDDGANNSDTVPDACRSTCVEASCGDGVKDSDEGCDDGVDNNNTVPGACKTTCVLPTCGNAVVDAGEECDAGTLNSDTTPDACREACIRAYCGDGVIDDGEVCDAGDNNSDTEPNGCRTSCQRASCGDGVVDRGESCDDGANNSDTEPNACRSICRMSGCGDGILDPGEACDDGLTNSDSVANACRTDCSTPVCGDGVTDIGEQCDAGAENRDDGTGACTTTCALGNCGNGWVDSGEDCDDSNLTSGDGCGDQCSLETGYVCTGQPSACTLSDGAGGKSGGCSVPGTKTQSSAHWSLVVLVAMVAVGRRRLRLN